jgi:hypothetical protein
VIFFTRVELVYQFLNMVHDAELEPRPRTPKFPLTQNLDRDLSQLQTHPSHSEAFVIYDHEPTCRRNTTVYGAVNILVSGEHRTLREIQHFKVCTAGNLQPLDLANAVQMNLTHSKSYSSLTYPVINFKSARCDLKSV